MKKGGQVATYLRWKLEFGDLFVRPPKVKSSFNMDCCT